MSEIENIMLCLSYALGRIPHLSEIRRAKCELANVNPMSVKKVIKSAQFLYPHMTTKEISLFKEQLCTCMLSAVNYRISMVVIELDSCGFSVCPRCSTSLDRDFQAFCHNCGQHLNWGRWKHLRRTVSE